MKPQFETVMIAALLTLAALAVSHGLDCMAAIQSL
jgi:hypothetical protein